MKTNKAGRLVKGVLAVTLTGFVTLTCAPANAAHEMIYAVDQNNNLFNFWSDAPGTILNQYAISGIQNAEEIRGLDYYSGTLYGLGSFSRLYTINPNDGVATQVGGVFSTILNGASFGWDNGPTGVRLASNLGQNLLIDRASAAVTPGTAVNYVPLDPYFGQAPRVDALAYDPASDNWFAADTLKNTLAAFNPATGGLSTIGMLGIDASTRNGMDISPFTGIMYIGTPAASSDPQANLYSVDKLTGLATLVGQIDVPNADTLIRGLTVVPEPCSVVLLALGAFGVFIVRNRRQ
jgi:hypothetical protein